MKTIYLYFSDLTEEKQNELMEIARADLLEDEDFLEDIRGMNKKNREIYLTEKAEQRLYEFNYEFLI